MANIVAGTPAKKLEKIEQGIAIVANGNTHAAITTGQYVYVKGHNTLAEGMYTATAAIAENAALSSSNLTAVSGGGLNSLKANIDNVNSKLADIEFHTGLIAVDSSVTITRVSDTVRGFVILVSSNLNNCTILTFVLSSNAAIGDKLINASNITATKSSETGTFTINSATAMAGYAIGILSGKVTIS